jgi:hypothetical protein
VLFLGTWRRLLLYEGVLALQYEESSFSKAEVFLSRQQPDAV